MKVLMLAWADWANTGWRFSKCLEMLGLDVTYYKGRRHHFSYPEQGQLHPSLYHRKMYGKVQTVYAPALQREVEKADVIHFIASTFVDSGVWLHGKRVIVQHGGSLYRQNFIELNNFFNPIVDKTIIQCPDLLKLGAKNEKLIYYPVDTKKLTPDFGRRSNKLLVGHFPSNTTVKGTQAIRDTIQRLQGISELRDRFEYVGCNSDTAETLPWEKHLHRIRNCDIIIETCNAWQGTKVFGEWGNSALESAALGKIVVTNSLAKRTYEEEYGANALRIANNPKQLFHTLRTLLKMSDSQIERTKRETREWVVNNHSMAATANRLWKQVYSEFSNG